ncbi:MAG: tetratricopeptide repeat protein [Epsilonproteobacteria bacterium]|nr:tetratricopeptide repeat protein [Campylobacterota bacterium]
MSGIGTLLFTRSAKSDKWLKVLVAALLALGAFVVYFPTLVYGFIFDDLPTIIRYPHVRVLDIKGHLFTNSRWVSRILNQLTYHFCQTSPFGYRIFNIFVHLAIGCMIFALLSMLFARMKRNEFFVKHGLLLSTLTTGLFLLHPVQTQTVTYITQMRLEGLVAFFTFAVLLTFVGAVQSKNQTTRRILYGISFVLAACATGTKEIVVALPFLVLLVDWFFIAEGDHEKVLQRWMVHAAYFAIVFLLMMKYGIVKPSNVASLVSAPLSNHRGNILTDQASQDITFFPFFISQFKVVLHYLKIFFWPFNLSFDYDVRLSQSIFAADVIVPFVVLLAGVWYAVRRFWQDRSDLIAFSFVWFLLAVLPRASFFLSTELICDYKTYLASFGACFFIAMMLVYAINLAAEYKHLVWSAQSLNMFKAGWTCLVLIFLAVATNQRNQVWSSELAFWEDVITKAPKARAYNNYGTSLWARNDWQGALKAFDKAVELDDWYAEPHINAGAVKQSRGDQNGALAHYKRAIEIGEGHPELFNNLGLLHFANKSFDTAEYCFNQALRLKPTYSRTLLHLAELYHQKDNLEQAYEYLERALVGDRQDEEMYYLHGWTCNDLGKHDKAIASLLRVPKNYRQTQFLLGCAYYQKRDYKSAASHFDNAYKRDSSNTTYAYNYAQALLNLHRYDQALPLFKQCSNLEGQLPYIPLHIARCEYELGHKQECKNVIDQLIARTPHEWIRKDAQTFKQEKKLA